MISFHIWKKQNGQVYAIRSISRNDPTLSTRIAKQKQERLVFRNGVELLRKYVIIICITRLFIYSVCCFRMTIWSVHHLMTLMPFMIYCHCLFAEWMKTVKLNRTNRYFRSAPFQLFHRCIWQAHEPPIRPSYVRSFRFVASTQSSFYCCNQLLCAPNLMRSACLYCLMTRCYHSWTPLASHPIFRLTHHGYHLIYSFCLVS